MGQKSTKKGTCVMFPKESPTDKCRIGENSHKLKQHRQSDESASRLRTTVLGTRRIEKTKPTGLRD
jgi:hypothetical protein